MDTRSINPSGVGNPTRGLDGNESMKQVAQAPDDTRIDILDQEVIEALQVTERPPYDVTSGGDSTQATVQSSPAMVSPPTNGIDDTVLNVEMPSQQEEQNGKLLIPGIIIACVHVYRISLNAFRE